MIFVYGVTSQHNLWCPDSEALLRDTSGHSFAYSPLVGTRIGLEDILFRESLIHVEVL